VPGYVIGVDGGNSKTDVVVASVTGRLLARRRGPGSKSPLRDPSAWGLALSGLVREAVAAAGGSWGRRPAECAVYCLANVDLPAEFRVAARQLSLAGLAARTVVRNDTVAVLRAGAEQPWGVAVVAGAGINAVGVHPSGRTTGFLALGDYTGDFGGGNSIGIAGLGAAMRAWDGRGPATVLRDTVPAHFGLRRVVQVAVAVHAGRIDYHSLHVLAPVVFAAAVGGDAVAAGILDQFSDEVISMATALIRRLHLTRTAVDVVLGGGTLQVDAPAMHARIAAGVASAAPAARVHILDVPPVFGALTEALRTAGATPSAIRKLRGTLAG
jgi:N-acetylglucosamine kinase-like BadF-type ATPase